MKKMISFLGVFLMLSSNAVLFAQMPVAMTPVAAPSGMEQIGIVAAAKGKVELTMPGQVGRVAHGNDKPELPGFLTTFLTHVDINDVGLRSGQCGRHFGKQPFAVVAGDRNAGLE